jgi:RNA polymerase sigma-70 factor (ECF subfamily)
MKLFIRGNTNDLSDALLIEKYKQSGDKFFVGELFKRYSHLVFGLCLKYFKDKDVSKDLVMQIFEKLFDELKKTEVRHFPAWICFVSRNFCISELRKEKTRSGREEVAEWEEEIALNPLLAKEEEAEHTTRLDQLKEAIQGLKEEHRICLDLFYLQEKSYKDICEMTGYSDKEVKSFIQNGKRNLKILLSQNNAFIPS